MRPVNEVVVLIAGVVPVAVDEAVVRAGAGPLPCGPRPIRTYGRGAFYSAIKLHVLNI